MPKSTLRVKATKAPLKPGSLGSARKEGKAAAGGPKSDGRVLLGIRARKAGAKSGATGKAPKKRSASVAQVAVRSPNVPDVYTQVDGEKYAAMKDILLSVLPAKAPGMTQGEMFDAVHATASKAKFPGSTARWWAKTVQLDLEAKGVLRRIEARPLRWHRA